MSEEKQTYQAQGPLYLRLTLDRNCQCELTIQGEITLAAIERLKAILDLVIPETTKAEEESK